MKFRVAFPPLDEEYVARRLPEAARRYKHGPPADHLLAAWREGELDGTIVEHDGHPAGYVLFRSERSYHSSLVVCAAFLEDYAPPGTLERALRHLRSIARQRGHDSVRGLSPRPGWSRRLRREAVERVATLYEYEVPA